MQKLGEIVGLGASKAKFLAGKVPDPSLGIKLEVSTSRFSGGHRIQLNDANVADLADHAIIAVAGKDLFQVPKALTNELADAAKWYREQMSQLANMVEKTLPLSEQLKQAQQLQDLLLKAAAHSLSDPALAATLREAFVRPSIEGLAAKLAKGADGLSGQALQEKILAELTAPVDKARKWFEPGACFAKGTLVHTKEGLKPIEQIQVGDWVLSKPENGGEQAYKRVLKTFVHEPQRIVDLLYVLPGQDRTFGQSIQQRRISVTRNHPFWTKEQGWTAVSELQDYESTFEDRSGQSIDFASLRNVYISDQPHVGWKPSHMGATDRAGALWNYDTHKLIAAVAPALETVQATYRELGDLEAIDPDLFFKAPVYNLEVEDFHTYYVGEHGIWVHNQNCGGQNFEARNTQHALPIAEALPNFHSRVSLANWFQAKGIKSQYDLSLWLRNNGNPDGVIRIRADGQSQADLIDAADWPKWLAFEEGVAGRLVSASDKVRWEYGALIWDSELQKVTAIAIEGAEKLLNFATLIDRKLAWIKGGKEKGVMDLLERLVKYLDAHPSSNWVAEFNQGIKRPDLAQFRLARDMLDAIKAGSTKDAYQIKKIVDDANGNPIEVIDTDAMAALRNLLDTGRISVRYTDAPVVLPQMVENEGTGLSAPELDLAHVYLQLGQARQYWLDQGASLARLNQASFAVTDLPQGWAARTEGSTVTLDTRGAGWGWFVDTSAQDNTEFVALDPQAAPGSAAQGDYLAAPGSAAEGRLDLLTVLIHELGHVLGLPMPQSADGSGTTGAHAMSQYLHPGQRRLPDVVDIAALQAAGPQAYLGASQSVTTGTSVLSAPNMAPRPAQALQAVNPRLQTDTGLNGWSSTGTVQAQDAGPGTSNRFVLQENAASQTRLSQAFVVGEGPVFVDFSAPVFIATGAHA